MMVHMPLPTHIRAAGIATSELLPLLLLLHNMA
jgi:hypothetical protein